MTISHDEAKEAALRLIASAFGRSDKSARFSIPCRRDDDDMLILEYINQQSAKDDAALAPHKDGAK